MANYRVISSDNHVFEAPDLWTSRAKPAFKDRVPQLVREYDGDWWYCDGHRVIGLSRGRRQVCGLRRRKRWSAPQLLIESGAAATFLRSTSRIWMPMGLM